MAGWGKTLLIKILLILSPIPVAIIVFLASGDKLDNWVIYFILFFVIYTASILILALNKLRKPDWLTKENSPQTLTTPDYLLSFLKQYSAKDIDCWEIKKMRLGVNEGVLYRIFVRASKTSDLLNQPYYTVRFFVSKDYGKIIIYEARALEHFLEKNINLYPENDYESNYFNKRYLVHSLDHKQSYQFVNPNLIQVMNNCQLNKVGVDIDGKTIRVFFRGEVNNKNTLDNLESFSQLLYKTID